MQIFFGTSFLFAFLFILIRLFVEWSLYDLIYRTLNPLKYPDIIMKKSRTKQICLFIFEIMYYASASVIGIALLSHTPYLIKTLSFERVTLLKIGGNT